MAAPAPAPLLKSTLERLLAESSARTELREAVETSIAKLELQLKDASHTDASSTISADDYWTPFKIACQHSQPARTREAALDCLQKLIAHNILRGALPLDPGVGEAPTPLPVQRRGSTTPGVDNDLTTLDISSPIASPEPPTEEVAPGDSSLPSPPPEPAATTPTTSAQPSTAPLPTPTPVITARSTSLLPNAAGDAPHYPPNPFLIDEIIHTVCTTFSGAQDEPVQLQVLKVLLTAVTSTACEVHQVSLLKVIQTCFNIHLNARTQVNQMTAKASLTQMVNLIFSRMERYAEVMARSLETGSMAEIEKLTGLDSQTGTQAPNVSTDPSGKPELEVESKPVASPTNAEAGGLNDSDKEESKSLEQVSLVSTTSPEIPQDADESSVVPAEDGEKEEVDGAPGPTVAAEPSIDGSVDVSPDDALTAVTQITTEASVISDPALESDVPNGADADTNGASESTPEPSAAAPSTKSIPESAAESHAATSPSGATEGNPYEPTIPYYSDLLRKDVFLVFRLLCRLSVTSENSQSIAATFNAANVKEAASMDEISFQITKARQLALELIMSVMNNCGPVFQSDEIYVGLIRQNLCLSISRNGVTTNPTLFELSLSIFLMVTRYFRSKLKTEIEVLLNTIYLHILEMGNSTYNQKRMVLQGLLKICENPQTLADMYVNNDCDIAMVSLFERIVNVCSRVAQGRDTVLPPAPTGLMAYAVSAAGMDTKDQLMRAQDRRLRLRGLVCLVALVNSLAEWSKDVAPNVPFTLRSRKGLDAPKTSIGDAPREDRKSIDVRPPSADNPNKPFSDALAATNQANPILVYKHPLHMVSLDHQMSHSFSTGSIASLHGGVTEAPVEDHVQIENMASRKQVLRNDVKLFNQKPKKGLKALIQHGFVEEDVVSIAKFLHNTDSLTKAAIGEYLGEGDAFSIEVMHAFIDELNFTDTQFVPALRAFLQTFRLPGEAQKIDRIMEKFADRYYENNPEVFAKADTAYTLAFSVIMLNTDQHSPTIKHRMDLAAYIKNNRGINDDGDLPNELLSDIFDQVSREEIIMEEEHSGKLAQMAIGWGAGDLNDRQRMELYRKEISQVQKKSLGVLSQSQKNRTLLPWRTAVGAEIARPMFGMASWALMAVFSLAFEGAGDDEDSAGTYPADDSNGIGAFEPKPADLCLEGFALSIRLASIFRMETERDAFVTSLSKLTGLSHIHDIRPKNIRAIKTLIMIADMLGEYLEGSWMQVLKAISQLERLQVIANRGSSFESKRSGEIERGENGDEAGLVPYGGARASLSNAAGAPAGASYRTVEDVTSQSRPNPAVEKLIAEFHNQATVVAVDRIFTNTLKLSATAIIHFFRCLCHVSMEEVGLDPVTTPTGSIPNAKTIQASGSAPRMYLLQKIVEIAYYNMPRIRFEWTQIWRILQPYFNTVACHPNVTVSTFAVDSLRQLSMKFLEREELGHWTAQNEFLRSFEWIMKHNPDPRIKELILSSTRQMIMARGKSLRSGWKSIFVVLSKAAQSGDEKIVNLAVSVVQMIFGGFFECVVGNAGAGFVDFVGCLVEITLVEGPHAEEVAAGGIQLLQAVAKWLSTWTGEVVTTRGRKVSFAENDYRNASVPPTPGGAHAHPQRLPSQPYLSVNGLVSEDHFFLKWFPILSAFSRIIIDSESVTVRTRAMDALFETLRTAGAVFEPGYWKNIQRSVILPIFAELGRSGGDDDDDDDDGANSDAEAGAGTTEGPPAPQRRRPQRSQKDPNVTAIYIHGLRLYIDLATTYFTTLSTNPDLLRSVFDLLVGMLTKRDEKLATTGGICLHGFIRDNMGTIDSDQVWGVVTDAVERAFRGTSPGDLLCCEYEPLPAAHSANNGVTAVKDRTLVVETGFQAARDAVGDGKRVTLDTLDFDYVLVKCVTHLELVQGVRDLVFGGVGTVGAGSRRGSRRESTLPEPPTPTDLPGSSPKPKPLQAIALIPYPFRRRWIQCLYKSYAIARAFNEETPLRYAIYKRGLVPQLPHLVKLETVSFATYLRVLFAAYRLGEHGEETDGNRLHRQKERTDHPLAADELRRELVEQTLDVLSRFDDFVGDQTRNALHVGLWSPVVVLVFKELLGVEALWRPRGEEEDGGDRDDASRSLLAEYIPKYFGVAVKMLGVDRADVRAVLQEFLGRVGEDYIRV
ncbi:Brefeldin A-inhibited guanine nucleotide-exchange protein 1 [Thoreauomyces humboldtii]|nr:Brefeldin A-inhibited guanine nucleotide-exchange protein 1 [Thoreauomyces humboldtii]